MAHFRVIKYGHSQSDISSINQVLTDYYKFIEQNIINYKDFFQTKTALPGSDTELPHRNLWFWQFLSGSDDLGWAMLSMLDATDLLDF